MDFKIETPYKIIQTIPTKTESYAWFISEKQEEYFIIIEAWTKVLWTESKEDNHEHMSGLILTDSGLYPADCLKYFEGYTSFKQTYINPFLRRTENPDDIIKTALNNVFSKRAKNVLKRYRIKTLDDLLKYSEEELLNLKMFGYKTLNEIRCVLANNDIQPKNWKPLEHLKK